jgi:hypothetical protein
VRRFCSKKPSYLRAKTISNSTACSYDKERIQSFIAQQPAARRTPAHHWLINSGASSPTTAHRDLFIAYRTSGNPQHVRLHNERSIYAVGIGHIALDVSSGRTTSQFVVQDVLHVPGLHGSASALSVSKLVRRGFTLTFSSDGCEIRSAASGIPIARAHVEDNLYILDAAASIHHARIRADCTYLDEPDEERHQLDPTTIECAFIGPASSRLAYMRANKPTGRFYGSRDVKFNGDSTSTPVRIRHQLDPATIEFAFIGLESIKSASICIRNLTDRFYESRDDKSDDNYASTPESIRLKNQSPHLWGLRDLLAFVHAIR